MSLRARAFDGRAQIGARTFEVVHFREAYLTHVRYRFRLEDFLVVDNCDLFTFRNGSHPLDLARKGLCPSEHSTGATTNEHLVHYHYGIAKRKTPPRL